jgi:hypothetical protein
MRLFPRFQLSATQLLATALAAITATIAASFLGVAGTVVGAALASVVSAIGTAVYSHSLRTTRARVRAGMQKSRMHAIAIGSVALFVTVLTIVTGVEFVTGRPLSDLVRGDTGSGTTVFGTTKNAAVEEPGPLPTVTQTVTPSVVVVTPTVTQTAPAVTTTQAPTGTPTAAPTATPSGPPAPSGTPTPSDQPTP